MNKMDTIIEKFKGKIPDKILKDFKKEATERKLNNKNAEKVLEHIKDEYEKAKINSGESIGVITAESFGEPGTQMSAEKNEKIIVKVNNQIKIIKIGKFVDELVKDYGSLKFKDTEILPINDLNILVPSLNKKEKIKWKKVIECSRHKTNKKLLKLVTKSGRSVTATDNHSFVIRKANDIVPIVGREL